MKIIPKLSSNTLHICFTAYHKFPKYSVTQKICCSRSKIWTKWLYHRVMSPNDADGMANSVDPDQTAPLGAVWSGSALFAQACLSENLGSLRYVHSCMTSCFACFLSEGDGLDFLLLLKCDCCGCNGTHLCLILISPLCKASVHLLMFFLVILHTFLTVTTLLLSWCNL